MKLNPEIAVDLDSLSGHTDGLVCLTGGPRGPIASALQDSFDEALNFASKLVTAFGRENVYAELQRHCLRSDELRNQAALEIGRTTRVPLLATNGVRFARPAERRVCDVLTCVRNKTNLAAAGTLLAKNTEACLKSAQEMKALFRDHPEAVANTAELSSRLEFTLEDLGYEFPKCPVPEGETMISFLRLQTDIGARRRYRPFHAKAQAQIRRELDVIEKLELAGYFLIVWNIVNFCRQNGILAQGRGSAANSAVCYSLGITAVDPVGMDLLFERFLSEQRGEWPDIDLDLPSGEQRERVIQWVYRTHGNRGAAMTANVITYRGRSAVREMGKALGFDEDTLSRLTSKTRKKRPSVSSGMRASTKGPALQRPLFF
jgi:error-prone DNA polymerase